MLKNEQKSAKTLPQKLAGLNKGRSAWGENLACGGVARCAFGAQWSMAGHTKFSKAQHGTAWRVWQRNGTAWQNSTARQQNSA